MEKSRRRVGGEEWREERRAEERRREEDGFAMRMGCKGDCQSLSVTVGYTYLLEEFVKRAVVARSGEEQREGSCRGCEKEVGRVRRERGGSEEGVRKGLRNA